ncbi:MAG TPA: phosphatase PAP2 family protein [Thermomicrobiales bacterium]|nr:phosphatase PAP2 family protein [Thermomicrobiales bacterium]
MGEWVEDARRESPASIVPNWIVVILLAIVLPLSMFAAGTSVLPGDVAITRFVQGNLPGVFEPLVVAANLIGTAPAMISIALVVSVGLFVRGHRRYALLVVGATLAQVANIALKLTLESPRPSSSLVQVSEQTSGFGFPSGHTMGTTVLALILLYVATRLMADGLTRRLVQSALLFVPLLTGIARIETGAHWPSDVLGAWIWGTLAAIAVVMLSQRSWNGFSLPANRPARSIKNTIAVPDMSGD